MEMTMVNSGPKGLIHTFRFTDYSLTSLCGIEHARCVTWGSWPVVSRWSVLWDKMACHRTLNNLGAGQHDGQSGLWTLHHPTSWTRDKLHSRARLRSSALQNLKAVSLPANTRRSPNVGTMLGHLRRPWVKIVSTSGESLVFAGNCLLALHCTRLTTLNQITSEYSNTILKGKMIW